MKNVAILTAVVLFVMGVLTSCASIVSGGPKTLPILSQPDEASLEVVDLRSGNTILKAKTPYTATLQRSAGFFQKARYKVKVSKEGFLPQEHQIEAGVNGWYFGNIVFGGLIGILIVDPATGAMWKIHDDDVNLKLYADTKEGRIAMASEKYNGAEAFKAGDYDKAIDDTTQAISLYPEYVDGYCVRGASYVKKGEFARAAVDLDKAVQIKPDFARAYVERAELCVAKGELDNALKEANKAIELKSDLAEAYFLRGKTHGRLSKTAEAKADITAACKMGYKAACSYQF